MTLKEFEEVKGNISSLKKRIEYLGKYLVNLDSCDGGRIPVEFATIEGDQYSFFFNVDSIKELTKFSLKKAKKEYLENIEELNNFGLVIEADPKIISIMEE